MRDGVSVPAADTFQNTHSEYRGGQPDQTWPSDQLFADADTEYE